MLLTGCGGVVVSASDLKVGGSTPSPCHRVVFLDKKLYPTLSLSTQGYKWLPAINGVTLQWTSIPSRGGIAILLVASCYRNWDKLRPCGPPWVVCDLTQIYTRESFLLSAVADIQ